MDEGLTYDQVMALGKDAPVPYPPRHDGWARTYFYSVELIFTVNSQLELLEEP